MKRINNNNRNQMQGDLTLDVKKGFRHTAQEITKIHKAINELSRSFRNSISELGNVRFKITAKDAGTLLCSGNIMISDEANPAHPPNYVAMTEAEIENIHDVADILAVDDEVDCWYNNKYNLWYPIKPSGGTTTPCANGHTKSTIFEYQLTEDWDSGTSINITLDGITEATLNSTSTNFTSGQTVIIFITENCTRRPSCCPHTVEFDPANQNVFIIDYSYQGSTTPGLEGFTANDLPDPIITHHEYGIANSWNAMGNHVYDQSPTYWANPKIKITATPLGSLTPDYAANPVYPNYTLLGELVVEDTGSGTEFTIASDSVSTTIDLINHNVYQQEWLTFNFGGDPHSILVSNRPNTGLSFPPEELTHYPRQNLNYQRSVFGVEAINFSGAPNGLLRDFSDYFAAAPDNNPLLGSDAPIDAGVLKPNGVVDGWIVLDQDGGWDAGDAGYDVSFQTNIADAAPNGISGSMRINLAGSSWIVSRNVALNQWAWGTGIANNIIAGPINNVSIRHTFTPIAGSTAAIAVTNEFYINGGLIDTVNTFTTTGFAGDTLFSIDTNNMWIDSFQFT